MTDDGDKEKMDEQLSLLDARARKRRRSSLIMTAVLVGITGSLVLQLARDIVAKQAQVRYAESSRGELDQRLKSEQEKLSAATRAREKLEAEIKELEATKRKYQNRILSEKDAHNLGTSQGDAHRKPTPTLAPTGRQDPDDLQHERPPETQGIDEDHLPPEALIIEESGQAPPGFFIKPKGSVTQEVGPSGRDNFRVHLEIDIPEDKRASVERVTYLLSPKYYQKNEINGGSTTPFEANFTVFACESTVLVRVKLNDGVSLAWDFDWCSFDGWPKRKREPVILSSEDEKTPSTPETPPRINIPTPQKSPQTPPPGRQR